MGNTEQNSNTRATSLVRSCFHVLFILLFICYAYIFGITVAWAEGKRGLKTLYHISKGTKLNRISQESKPMFSGITNKSRDVVIGALHLIGVRYHWGGNTPNTGLDCSGFVKYVFQETLNFKLPRSAEEMSRIGRKIGFNELKAGDLVFFKTRHHNFSHVGIYIGNNKFVHAPSTGTKIRVDNLSAHYWLLRYKGARRIENTIQSKNTLEGK